MKTITLTIIIISVTTLAFFLSNNRTPVSTAELDKDVSLPATDTIEETSPETEPEEIFELKVEKPASFAGVEMVTYQSEYGFKITYPKEWQSGPSELREIDRHENSLGRFTIVPEEIRGPVGITEILITVENSNSHSVEEELQKQIINNFQYTRNLVDLVGFRIININHNKGIFKKITDVSAYYFFLKNSKFYIIDFYYNSEQQVTEDEALWVLSTFKITD